ncbi:hypothetical protein L7F22_034558, partial [Adiantum nelumboides]|nr:hypothetical protein [Adiantum nelumboides]
GNREAIEAPKKMVEARDVDKKEMMVEAGKNVSMMWMDSCKGRVYMVQRECWDTPDMEVVSLGFGKWVPNAELMARATGIQETYQIETNTWRDLTIWERNMVQSGDREATKALKKMVEARDVDKKEMTVETGKNVSMMWMDSCKGRVYMVQRQCWDTPDMAVVPLGFGKWVPNAGLMARVSGIQKTYQIEMGTWRDLVVWEGNRVQRVELAVK